MCLKNWKYCRFWNHFSQLSRGKSIISCTWIQKPYSNIIQHTCIPLLQKLFQIWPRDHMLYTSNSTVGHSNTNKNQTKIFVQVFKFLFGFESDSALLKIDYIPNLIDWHRNFKSNNLCINKNKTKSIGVSEANYSCIWFLNGDIINSYQ